MDLKRECQKTFYRELYHFEDKTQRLLMDETTQKLYLRKEKQFYDLQVYHYLKTHHSPYLANVHDFWEEDGKLVIIEEYIEGQTLENILQQTQALQQGEAMRILACICEGLRFLHQAVPQIVHRDLKAANVMLTKDGAVKLIDYDAAKTVKDGADRDTMLIGTQGNAAPEQYGFAQSDARTDIYALGILIRGLFPGTPQYAPVIQKATQMDPSARYQSTDELLRAIREIRDGSTPKNQGKRGKRRLLPWLLAGVAVVAAIICFFVWRHTDETQTMQQENNVNPVRTEDATGTQKTVVADGASSGRTQVETGNADHVIEMGTYRMTVPGDWKKENDTYYLEKGENMAFLTVATDPAPGLRTEDIPLMEEELKRSMLAGLQYLSVTEMSSFREIDINGIKLYCLTYEGTYGLYDVGVESYYFCDEIGEEMSVISFAQALNETKDHGPQFQEVLQTLVREDMLPAYNWKQVYHDREDLVTMNGHILVAIANVENDTITIWWLEEDTGWNALFWKGSFNPKSVEEGKQICISQKVEGLDGAHVSLDSTKSFEIENDIISYIVWRADEVWNIHLERVDASGNKD
ncbi:MAG: serine/threonine protein kinase [Lachnospiraceae bacterium]|nr:serine/threonine protein kinase [Lachnospiraceae bacterium]